MRRLRWLLPPVIIAIVIVLGKRYIDASRAQAKNAPPKPAPLASGIASHTNEFCVVQSDGDRPRFEVCAASSTQLASPPVTQLEGVRIKLYVDDARKYDYVTADKAQFDQTAKKLTTDGDFKITIGVPSAEETPQGHLLSIAGESGEFSSETGVATTDKPVRFEFAQGSGTATGAHYDPATRELRLDKDVVLDWHGKKKDAKPMHIESGQAWYFEKESKVLLYPWAKLTREGLHMESAASEIILDQGRIRRANVPAAKGVQDAPNRKTEFAAKLLNLDFDDDMLIKSMHGDRDASVIATTAVSKTKVAGDKLDLVFMPAASGKESVLTSAVATGTSMLQADPVARPGVALADTRILRSDVIHMAMRPGGEEIDHMETDGPGTLDFVPNRPDSSKRNLRGDQIWINYGAANRIEKFRSTNAYTRTERPAKPATTASNAAAPNPPMLTESKELIAHFDPMTSELTNLEQNTGFRYEEGERTARADHATLDQANSLITLFSTPQTGSATSTDPTGTILADKIILNQKSGDTTAEGRVATTRQPNKKASSNGVFSNEEKLQVTAQRMLSTNKNQRIRYDGNAIAWQGANRVEADRIEVDQEKHVLEAHGKVMTQFVDSSKDSDKNADKSKPKTIFTVVHAPDLIYTEETRLAYYKGGVRLERPGLTSDSQELRAFLKDSSTDDGKAKTDTAAKSKDGKDADSSSNTSLDKAYADGDAKIVSVTINPTDKSKRTRVGTGDRAEFYADEQKVILVGGKPLLVDTVRGRTTGSKLTWWANNDRLLVDGEESKPPESVIRKKK